MERIVLTEDNIGPSAERAAEVVRAGGVVLYPTDTLYGLGADAFSDRAVDKVIAIKGRDEKKPIHAIVSDLEMAGQYGIINDAARTVDAKLPRGKIAVIVKKKEGVDSGIARGVESFGYRIPQHEFCLAFVRAFGGPITATSANRSGLQPQRTVETILEQLGTAARQIDLVIDEGELPIRLPSTVVDVSRGSCVVLREGGVPAGSVRAVC